MPITTKVVGGDQAQAELSARLERLVLALQRKIFSLSLQLVSKIQGNLASGIGLKSQHGTSGLAGSVRTDEPTIDGNIVIGQVEGAGGTSWYGAMWEGPPLGMEPGGHREIVPVNKKALHFLVAGKSVFAMRVAAQGPRPWFDPPWQEFKPTIAAELEATAKETI